MRPGEPILAGELAKGLEILAGGGDIDYQGATGVELIGPGEAGWLVSRVRDQGQRGRHHRVPLTLAGPVRATRRAGPNLASAPE